MPFAEAATIPLPPMVFGCGALVNTLPYGSALLEESLASMSNAKNSKQMAPKDTLVCHPREPLLL